MPTSAKKSNIPKARCDFYRNCRIPYEPRAIRESNTYGPISQKYDDYIKLWEDHEENRSSRRSQYVLDKLTEINKNDLDTVFEKTSHVPKIPCKPIIHCYTDINNTVTTKKSPIKKICFALPDEKVPKCMDWNDYHPLEVIHKFVDDLEAEFPSICTTGSIGQSVEGRSLKILKISNSNANNVAVWMDSGIHGREWIAPAVNTYIANHISRNFENLPDSVTNKDWYFLPVVNPDGYHYAHTADRLWRKNRAFHMGQCCGVDLNRNFSYGYGSRGSSSQPNSAFYKGPYPFSEPESSAMRDIFLNSGIKFKVYITLHSYGQIIIFPYACTTALAPDYIRLLQGATAMSKAIYNTNGKIYKVGISRDVMYGAGGTSSDFAHGGVGIPFCYLIELRSKKYKFKLPKEQIEDTGNEILSSVIALMEFVDTCPDQNIDVRIDKNTSLMKESYAFVHPSKAQMKKCASYNKKDYSYIEKNDPSMAKRGSFIRWSSIPMAGDISLENSSDAVCDTQWVSYDNENDCKEEKCVSTSEEKTNPYKEIVDYYKKANQCLESQNKMNSSIYENDSSTKNIDTFLNQTYTFVNLTDTSLNETKLKNHSDTSINKTTSINQTDFSLDQSESSLNQTNPSINQTDSSINKTMPSGNQTNSILESDDSYEAWQYFFKQQNDFKDMRNNLLTKTAEAFVGADIQGPNVCHIYT